MSADRVAVPRATQGGPALSVHNLSKLFGDWTAFQDVSFEIGYGEIFGFLGPNGAGKTTTVRTLGTLIAGSQPQPGDGMHRPQAGMMQAWPR